MTCSHKMKQRPEFEQYYSAYKSRLYYTLMRLVVLGILNFALKWKLVDEVIIKSFCYIPREPSEILHLSNFSLGNRVLMAH